MRAGTLNNLITFVEQGQTQNDWGEVINSNVKVLTTYASIEPISGKEQFLSNQNYSTLSHKIKLRYSDLVNAKQTIKFENRKFNILAVFNIKEQNKELEILAEEII